MQDFDSTADHSDVELLLRVRAGDLHAEHALLARHRSAIEYLPPSSWYASVEESGSAAIALVRQGNDQDLPFRATWLAVHAQGEMPDVPARDRVVWSAFGTLPAAWRLAVWHREVEGQPVRDIALLLGMSEQQARRALASSYAAMKRRAAITHSAAGVSRECEHLVSVYRFSPAANMSTPEIRALREHGRHCDDCLELIRNLLAIEHTLRDLLAGVVLGAAAESYLAQRPRAARLRVASSSAGFERRGVHPVLASLSATAVGAGAMALVLSTSALAPSPTGPATAQKSAPIPGANLQAAVAAHSRAPVGLTLTQSLARDTPTGGQAAELPGDEGVGGHGGLGPDAAGTPPPAQPGAPLTPQQPDPTVDPSPGPGPSPDPSPTPNDAGTVAVVVTSEQVAVSLDPGDDPEDSVVIEVPMPDPVEVPVTLPFSSTGSAGQVPQ